LKWAKDHGAVGLFFRGLEKDRNLDDPYFFPVYQAAMEQRSGNLYSHRRRLTGDVEPVQR
jgi:hypothetical protein